MKLYAKVFRIHSHFDVYTTRVNNVKMFDKRKCIFYHTISSQSDSNYKFNKALGFYSSSEWQYSHIPCPFRFFRSIFTYCSVRVEATVTFNGIQWANVSVYHLAEFSDQQYRMENIIAWGGLLFWRETILSFKPHVFLLCTYCLEMLSSHMHTVWGRTSNI